MDRKRAAHLCAAMIANLKGDPRRALYHAVLAERDEASDAALTEQALALEQMGLRRLARDVWGIVRRRNPGMGSWNIVAAVFIHDDAKARRRMERWESWPKKRV